MRICETEATQASPTLGTFDAVYGPGITCIVYCDEVELQGGGKVTVQMSVVGFILVCECQWMNVQHGWWSYGDFKCWDPVTDVTESNTAFLCVGIPQCQHIARPVILRCAKTLSLSVYKTGTLIFFLLLPHNHATASRREERIETYTNGVWCEALTIKNINGKK